MFKIISLISLILFISFVINAEINYSKIADLIWHNESGGKSELLIFWNPKEEFPSLGIGHFIWYPCTYKGPFEQVFGQFIQFCLNKKKFVPNWLCSSHAPWRNRAEFVNEMKSARSNELRELLEDTRSLQAQFMKARLQNELPKIIAHISQERQNKVKKWIQTLQKHTSGMYTLIDYLNFKGSGLKESERYNNDGWGLMHVLQEMKPKSSAIHDILNAFADAAVHVLQRRIKNSPPQRNEHQFLNGWIKRISTYRMNR